MNHFCQHVEIWWPLKINLQWRGKTNPKKILFFFKIASRYDVHEGKNQIMLLAAELSLY